jgi:hypothetical protein
VTAAAAKTVLTVDFTPKRPQRATVAPTGRIPRVVRMLALAHRIEGMVRDGMFRDHADAARRLGLTRARVTQITSLVLLAPEIQEEILDLPPVAAGRDPISERQLRPIVAEPVWERQMEMCRRLASNREGLGAYECRD